MFKQFNQKQNKSVDDGFDKTDQNNQTQTKPNSLITTLGSLLPFAPLVYEQLTGQKVPAVTGTMAEMQMSLVQINSNLQAVINNQNQLTNRINQLETNANQQLNNLTHQFKNLRLTHTKEQKQIEFDRPQLEEEN